MKKKLVTLLLALSSVLVLGAFAACDDENDNNFLSYNTSSELESSSELEPELKKWTVTLDYNDGSGRKKTISVPEGATVSSYLSYPVEEDKEVVGWSLYSQGVPYQAEVFEDITLYAQWQTIETTVLNSNIPSKIMDRFVEIRPDGNEAALDGKIIYVGAGVERVSFVSNGTIYNNVAIIIDNRFTDLEIRFDKFGFSSKQSFGIKTADNSTEKLVHIVVNGFAGIDCTAANGADCINIPNLKISGNGEFSLRAGNGISGTNKPDAGNGQNGENGGHGTNGGCGIIAKSLEVNDISLKIVAGNGGNGGRGGSGNNSGGLGSSGKYKDGGSGGQGGKGGDAVVLEKFKANNAQLSFTAGNGGRGGNGGNGGGSSSTFAGRGGNGGNGGNGGCVFAKNIKDYTENGAIVTYTSGSGGYGGSGGDSAHASKKGSAGANGSQGILYISQ